MPAHRTLSPARPRNLRACLGCGAKCTTTPCPRCSSGPRLTHDDAEYRRNRAIILARATHCALCGQPPTPDDPLTCDHIRPITAGGTHAITNLQAAHESCNKSTGATFKGGGAHRDPLSPAAFPAFSRAREVLSGGGLS